MTVGDLRKALEGVPDELMVAHNDEAWWRFATRAEVALTKPRGDHDLGDIDECKKGEPGTPAFLID